jgi:3-oxoacyl-[acyl-carrier-protein] synthase-3
MMERPFAEVASVGVAVPSGILTNADLSRVLDTSDEWIVERTGIRERHIATAEQSVAQLSHEAATRALAAAGVTAAELDAIVLATASPDRLLPSTACDLQALLGAENAAAFDIGAACPGYIYALTVAEGLIASGQSRTVLVVGAEKLSTITSSAMAPGRRWSAARRRRAAASSPPTSSRTDGSHRCSTGPAAAPPIRSARRWSASGRTT